MQTGMAGSKPRNSSKRNARAGGGATLQFTIPSDDEHMRQAQRQILEELENNRFNSHSTFAVKIALEEALINAIKHGNKRDKSKQVKIEAKITPAVAEITIEDQGPGFDRSTVPDPTEEENLEKCSGRGILLMEAYMNSVKWTNKGRRVKMVKRNEAEAIAG
jgi:serine/threonine-protein kinase RsbW